MAQSSNEHSEATTDFLCSNLLFFRLQKLESWNFLLVSYGQGGWGPCCFYVIFYVAKFTWLRI